MTRAEYLKAQITAIMPDVANLDIDWEQIHNYDWFESALNAHFYFYNQKFDDCGLALDYLKETDATLENAMSEALQDYQGYDINSCILAEYWAGKVKKDLYDQNIKPAIIAIFFCHEYQVLELAEELEFLAEKHSKERQELIDGYDPEVFNELQRAGLRDSVEEIKNIISEFYDSQENTDEVTK